MSFQASVRQSGDVAIIDLSGRVVLGDGSAKMRDAIKQVRDEGNTRILLNFADVTFVDSSGLGELASAYSNVTGSGGQLKLVNTPSRVVELLRITKLDGIFPSFSDEPTALKSFSAEAAKA
jgi:anti-anti-sigma factor